MALGNSLDKAPFDGLVGELSRGPVTDGAPRDLRWLASDSHDLTPLLSAKGGRRPRAWGILQALQRGAVETLKPVSTPSSDGQAASAQGVSDLTGIVAIGELQNDLGSETHMWRRFMGASQGH